MMRANDEIPTGRLVSVLRVYVEDLTSKDSSSHKSKAYLRELAGWIACAATRIEKLSTNG